MIGRGIRGAWPLVACALFAGCAMLRMNTANPPVEGEWASVLAQARQEALAMRFGVADHLLSDFADRHTASVEALDATFYRALFKLDPSNATGTVREAEALLDAYLAVSGPLPLRGDATSLRRVATALERGPPLTASAPTSSSPASSPQAGDKAKDEEVQRLRDELAKANAELDRIKRRLAQPKP